MGALGKAPQGVQGEVMWAVVAVIVSNLALKIFSRRPLKTSPPDKARKGHQLGQGPSWILMAKWAPSKAELPRGLRGHLDIGHWTLDCIELDFCVCILQ